MKFAAVFLVLLAVFAQHALALERINNRMKNQRAQEPKFLPTKPPSEKLISDLWIEQRLDHFDQQNNRTWIQRYFENDEFLVEGGPVFIFVGGEWTISSSIITFGHMHDMARDLNATIYYTEQRFFGTSRPTEDASVENLRYLNAAQILADTAHFIEHIKSTIPQIRNSGVILFGASYSASLVTWFQQKYPHLSKGAWASSAPLLAQVDFAGYMETVSDVLKEVGGSECSGRTERAFAELERLVAVNETNTIAEVLHMCDPLDVTNQLDVWSFFHDLAGAFMAIVQVHSADINFIGYSCEILTQNPNISDIEAVSILLFGDWTPGEIGFCYDPSYVNWMFHNETNWDRIDGFGFRQLQYKFCSEVSLEFFFKTSSDFA